MQRGFGSYGSTEGRQGEPQSDPIEARDEVDASLGFAVAPTDRERLAYMADLISQFQSMAIDMRLGMLARILSVAVAETGRLLDSGTPPNPQRAGSRTGR